ncbi:MAG: Ig-like domain-containing protein [Paludibacter sp.]|nr:Ig-like domain-containing protein [Paludibacter sp.]
MKKVNFLFVVALFATLLFFACRSIEMKKEVTSIEIDKTTLAMQIGEQQFLTATVMPKDADQNVLWISNNVNIVSVDNNGKLTALAKGNVTITAKAGSKTAICEVSVLENIIEVESVTLSQTTLSLVVGQSQTLTATVLPTNATDKSVAWTSSNASVASVANGFVTAKSVGSTTITAKAGNKTATCMVTVSVIAVTSITLIETSLSLPIDETTTLIATVLPANATDKSVTWTSSNSSVASVVSSIDPVDGVCLVVANAVGNATITAKAGDKIATCVVTVNKGALINGVWWATRNVDAFHTFAPTQESAGKFYQWNRPTAWPVTGTVWDWDGTIPTGNTWTATNDPCPDGWRVPTRAELTSLNNSGSSWVTQNGVRGRRFGTGHNQIFLPAVGYRDGTLYGTLYYSGTNGLYWSSTEYNNTDAFFLLFDSTDYLYIYSKVQGLSVRCVAE